MRERLAILLIAYCFSLPASGQFWWGGGPVAGPSRPGPITGGPAVAITDSPDDYVIEVKTDNAGTSNNDQFTLPATGTYDVDWGDGTTSTGVTGIQTHTYPSAGTYIIKVSGGLERINFSTGGDELKLLDIKQWGAITWTSMASAYKGCANMTMSATDAPDLSGVTDTSQMFFDCTIFNSPLDHWDVSNVDNMSSMFYQAYAFNQDLNSWNTGNVTSMSNMFAALVSGMTFNGNITSWNTGAVANMVSMFRGSSAFNQPIGSWDVGRVTNFSQMFFRAGSFNQNLDGWNIGANLAPGTPINMANMFDAATAFNGDITTWDTSAVTNMSGMFLGATAFDQDIGSWDVGDVTVFVNFMLGKTDATFSAANLDAIYNGWIANELSPSESITFGTAKYTAAGQEGRDLLTRTNATVSVTGAVDNGSGLIRITAVAHGRSTGDKVFIKDVVGTTEANGLWTVTVVGTDEIDLDSSTFTNAYVSGGTVITGYGWTVVDGGINAWTPADLGASLALWLDADDASTITLNGTTVSQWNDKSGNARHASQATATNQPTYNTAGLNSEPTIDFDGTDDFFSVPEFNTVTVFLVGNKGAPTYPQLGGAAPATFIPTWNVNNDSVVYRSASSTTIHTVSLGGAATEFAIGCIQLDISANKVFINGNGGSITTFNETLNAVDGRVNTVGRDFAGGDQFFDGSIAEIITLNNLPSTADRQKVEGYLAHKWGLEANLPVGHPYKVSPP